MTKKKARSRTRSVPPDDGGLFLVSNSSREFFSTGCSMLDNQLGGGYAQGQIISIRGDTGSGKSLLGIEAGPNFQRKYPRGIVRFIDREGAHDEGYTRLLGIDPSRFVREQDPPVRTMEEFTAYSEAMLDVLAADPDHPPVLDIVDSVDALTTSVELSRSSGAKSMGMEKAKLGQEYGRRVSARMPDLGGRYTLLLVSQVRLGSIPGTDVVVRKSSGGSWLKFYPTQVLDLKTKAVLKSESKGHKREFGRWIEVVCVKNRRAGPNMPIMIPIRYNWGVDDLMACVRFLADEGRADLMFDGKGDAAKKRAMLFCTGARRLTAEKYAEHLGVARAHAAKLFVEIRNMFMPTHSKYGGD